MLRNAAFVLIIIFLYSCDSLSDLYGINVRPVAPFGSVSRKPYVDTALIHRCLPDELLFEVLLLHVTQVYKFIEI